MNKTSLTRLDQLNPLLQNLTTELCAKFDVHFPGWTLEITQGRRSYEEQDALYAQGRETLDQVNALRAAVGWAAIVASANVVVTNAKAGYSWHPFGLAVDVAPESAVGIDWDGNDEHWDYIVETGESLGLKSGISWKDEPHFQLANIPVTPTTETRIEFAQNGVEGVWQSLGDSSIEAT